MNLVPLLLVSTGAAGGGTPTYYDLPLILAGCPVNLAHRISIPSKSAIKAPVVTKAPTTATTAKRTTLSHAVPEDLRTSASKPLKKPEFFDLIERPLTKEIIPASGPKYALGILRAEVGATEGMAFAESDPNVLVAPDGRKYTTEELQKVSLNVSGGTAQRVVTALLLQTKLNVVLLGSNTQPMTIKLTDTPLIEAVRHLCALGNMRFLRLPKTIVIGPDEMLKRSYPVEYAASYEPAEPKTGEASSKEPQAGDVTPIPIPAPAIVTRVVSLNHLPANQAAISLKPLMDARGCVCVAAPAVQTPQLGALASIGNNGGASSSNSNSASATPVEGVSRVLIVSGPEAEVLQAIELIRSLDIARQQVRIDVTMHDVNNDALKDLGISWSFGGLNLTEAAGPGFLFGKFDRSRFTASAVIQALETSDRARLLASPNITVQDGDRGFVLIGDRLTFPVLIGYSQANTPIFDKQEERVGIYLQVSAQVADDGTVTMSLAPQVSTIKGYIQVNGGSYPQIATREAQSTIRIKSGESIVMGGLIRDEEISHMEKVPILGDIPVFGELFRRRKRQHTASQLIITVTPTVLPS